MLHYFVVRAPIGQVLGFGTIVSKSVDHENKVTSLVCDSGSGDYRVLVRKSTNGAPIEGDGLLFKNKKDAVRYSDTVTGWRISGATSN